MITDMIPKKPKLSPEKLGCRRLIHPQLLVKKSETFQIVIRDEVDARVSNKVRRTSWIISKCMVGNIDDDR